MRERRGSLLRIAVGKVRREGFGSLVREAPVWVTNNAVHEAQLAAIRWWRVRRYRRAGMTAIPDPTATIEVDPQRITHLVPLSRFETSSPRSLLGTIRDSDWDRDPIAIEELPKYQACRARVEDDVPWVETGIIDRLAADLVASDEETIEHGCGSRADLRARYENERESLYQSLRNEGYDRSESPVCCRVHIGRDGQLLFGSGGRHRFYLSRLVGIDSVPVQVLCRHRQWQAIREMVANADTARDLPESVRDRLDHPDLQSFDVAKETTPTVVA